MNRVLMLCLLLLAACGREAHLSALPTLAQLPTASPTFTPSPTATAVVSAASEATPSLTPSTTPTATPTASITPSLTVTLTSTPSATMTPSPTITDTQPAQRLVDRPTVSAAQMSIYRQPLELAFDSIFSLSLEHRRAVTTALNANRYSLPAETRFTVSAYRDIDGWAKVTLVPTRFVESGWANVESIAPFVLEIILRQRDTENWDAFLIGSAELDALLPELPHGFVDLLSPVPALAGEYRLPWQDGHSWWATQGWHDGSAIDFQPGLSARYGVLAAQSGILSEICSDGYQSLLQIQHEDGNFTYYLHVMMALRVRRSLLDQAVVRGQYLGDILRQTDFETPCGRGGNRHLHFVVTDRSMVIDGYALDQIASSAVCCTDPPLYTSTNVRVDLSTQ